MTGNLALAVAPTGRGVKPRLAPAPKIPNELLVAESSPLVVASSVNAPVALIFAVLNDAIPATAGAVSVPESVPEPEANAIVIEAVELAPVVTTLSSESRTAT